MSTTYRISRCIEASIIDHLTTELAAAWSSVNAEKTFARVYTLSLPTVCVRVSDTIHDRAEIGANSTVRTALVLIDLFCTSDGQRLDLKDFLVSTLKGGCVYYEYVINNGTVQSKTANGRIRILNIDDTIVNLDTDKSELDVHDRYRHLISINVSLGTIET